MLNVKRSSLKIHLEGQKYSLSQVQSKLLIRIIHMDFFLQTYMSGSTPTWSRKKPIGVFFFKPKVSATLLTCECFCYNNMVLKKKLVITETVTLLLVLRQRKEAWRKTSRMGKMRPERAKRMQLNWYTTKQKAAMRTIPSFAAFPLPWRHNFLKIMHHWKCFQKCK